MCTYIHPPLPPFYVLYRVKGPRWRVRRAFVDYFCSSPPVSLVSGCQLLRCVYVCPADCCCCYCISSMLKSWNSREAVIYIGGRGPHGPDATVGRIVSWRAPALLLPACCPHARMHHADKPEAQEFPLCVCACVCFAVMREWWRAVVVRRRSVSSSQPVFYWLWAPGAIPVPPRRGGGDVHAIVSSKISSSAFTAAGRLGTYMSRGR